MVTVKLLLPALKPYEEKISNPSFLLLSEIITILFQPSFYKNSTRGGLERLSGEICGCKMNDLCFLLKCFAPREIGNSASLTPSKTWIRSVWGKVRGMHESPYFLM